MALDQKRGDSLMYMGEIPESFADGFFAGWEMTSQIRKAQYYTLIDDLVVEWVDPGTTREFTLSKMDTTAWPVGPALIDVQFVRNDGFTKSTDTIQVNIVHDITYPEPVV